SRRGRLEDSAATDRGGGHPCQHDPRREEAHSGGSDTQRIGRGAGASRHRLPRNDDHAGAAVATRGLMTLQMKPIIRPASPTANHRVIDNTALARASAGRGKSTETTRWNSST